ncbi:MAG: metallophosphoesterase [Armatimonadota bacterium]
MRLAITADLHWGVSRRGDRATRALRRRVEELAPDLFAIAGDVGEGGDFARCLALFSGLSCPRVLVPGNHDLWIRAPGASSLALYRERLPRLAVEHGFHYLDTAPLVSDDGAEAVVGSINWYDYSFADPELEREIPAAPRMYREKRFPRGVHNDGRFVSLEMDDPTFTGEVVEQFRRHLAALPPTVTRVTVIQHHPPVRELFWPGPITHVEGRFWLAFTGNRRMQDAVLDDARIAAVVCGHTHAACTAEVAGRRCFNVGGDYDWKRLLLLDTGSGEEQAWEFRD